MSWITLTYAPATFFSLRPAHATSSGGKTLLCPTAFALKMALLNASIQTVGLEEGRRRFTTLRDLRIALRLPEQITVLKSFAKIQRPVEIKDSKGKDETVEEFQARVQQKIAELMAKGQYPFRPTIAYREFVQFGNPTIAPYDERTDRERTLDDYTFDVACTSPAGEIVPWLGETLLAINYLGKRGGFVQPLFPPAVRDELNVTTFTEITRDSKAVLLDGTLQMLDDCGPALTFEQANIYSSKRITLGKDRVLRHVVLPYRLDRSSRGYSHYVRINVREATRV